MHVALLLAASLSTTSAGAPTGCSDKELDRLFLYSSTVIVSSAAFDIATAHRSAQRYNRRHFSVAPLIDPRGQRYGLAFSLGQGRASSTTMPQGPRKPKSLRRAFALSAGWTAGPMLASAALVPVDHPFAGAVFASGLVFGPGAGHFYAARPVRALGGIVLRLVIGVVAIGSAIGCQA